MAEDDKPQVLSPEEQAEVEALRETIKGIKEQIDLAKRGSSSHEFREDLQILLREAQAELDGIVAPSTEDPPA